MNAQVALEKVPDEALYPRLRLRAHDSVWIGNEEHHVAKRQGDKWVLVNFETQELRIETDVNLLRMFGLGLLRLRSRSTSLKPLSPIALTALGEEAHAAASRKHAYVEHALNHPDGYRNSKRWLRKPIREKAKELGDSRPPSPSSIIGWVKLHDPHYREIGLAAYANRHDLKGKRGSRLPEPMKAAIQRSIDRYLQGGSVEDAYLEAERYIDAFNATAEGRDFCANAKPRYLGRDGRLKPPSLSTLRRELHLNLSPFIKSAGRIGIHYARKHGRTFQTRALPDKPYAEVEVDFTPLDVLVVDENGALLGRPHLIVFLDRATRVVVGMALSFEVPSYAAVLDGLRSATYRKNIGHIDGLNDEDWPCMGRIERLFIDNGKEFANGQLAAAAVELGFEIHRLPPREPWHKGLVERFMGSVAAFTHNLPGTTLSNSVQRRDYENIDPPVLTLSECRDLVTKWIVTVYNRRPNRMLGSAPGVARAPIDAWRDKLDLLDIPGLPDPELFIALSGERAMRTVQKYGVEWDHIRYWSPELDRILAHPKHQLKSTKTDSAHYQVRRDPYDLSRIFLFNHHANEVIELPVVERWQQYAQGLSVHQHRMCREHESIREEQRSDPKALWKARAALIEAGRGALRSGMRKKLERNLTRFLYGNRAQAFASNLEASSTAAKGEEPISLSAIVEAPLLVLGETSKPGAQLPHVINEDAEYEPVEPLVGADMDEILHLAARVKSGSRHDD